MSAQYSNGSPTNAVGGHDDHTPETTTTVQPVGCNLRDYAALKRLPVEFLADLGLSDAPYSGMPAVRIPYRDRDGTEVSVRYRIALSKGGGVDQRFAWEMGHKPLLYGLWRAQLDADHVVLVEGESDTQTLWHHGVNVLGLPGATVWNEERDAPALEPYHTVYVVLEPDAGADAMLRWLKASSIRHRCRIVRLDGFKDPSEMHIDDPDAFRDRWQDALRLSVPWDVFDATAVSGPRRDLWKNCEPIGRLERILDEIPSVLRVMNFVGEERAAKLIYLMLTTRLLDRPVSVAVKGPSSAGKSFLVDAVLKLFPPSAYYPLTAMSDRALAYGDEPLKHRVLVVFEAAGSNSEMASYFVRSLLSEDRVIYEFVEKTAEGLKVRRIEREGPTGLLTTTTAIGLHPENETRLLSLMVKDTTEQTRDILIAQGEAAATGGKSNPDLGPWRHFQTWLALGATEVVIPFARDLAQATPAVAVRLRRDFPAVLSLIKAHALLHQVDRRRDRSGRIVASLDDYSVVRELIDDLIGEGVQASVSTAVRETVDAVTSLMDESNDTVTDGVTAKQVGCKLGIDRSPAWRRCKRAIEEGYLKNLEDRRGRPGRLVLGDPLPDDRCLLPAPSDIGGADDKAKTIIKRDPEIQETQKLRADGCAVDAVPQGGPGAEREQHVI